MHVRHLPVRGRGSRVANVLVVAVTTAALTALLYYLIGLGIIWIGTSTNGSSTDLGAFGAIVGTTFAVMAVLLARFHSRLLWAVVAVLQGVVLVGYVAVGSARSPAFEPWGLLIKACQVVLLVTMAYLLLHSRDDALQG
jgi:hypothetical protein